MQIIYFKPLRKEWKEGLWWNLEASSSISIATVSSDYRSSIGGEEMTVFHNDDMQRGITFGDGEDGIFPMSLLNKKGEIEGLF